MDVQVTGDPVGVEGVHRLAEQEHDVVGDVGRGVDRTLTAQQQLALQPVGRLGVRVDAGDLADAEACALGGLVDGDRRQVATSGGVRQPGQQVGGQCGGRRVLRRVAVGQVEGAGELTCEASGGQGVAAVRGHVDLEDRVVQAEELAGVGTDDDPGVLGLGTAQRDDAGGLHLRQSQFCGGADHALGGFAVGLACADGETAGQHRTWQRDDDDVALAEVPGTADDVLRFAGAVGVADVDVAVADRLLEALQLLDVLDPAEHQRPGGLLDVFVALGLESDAHEAGVQFSGVDGEGGGGGPEKAGQPGL